MKILLVFLLSYWTIFQNAASVSSPELSEITFQDIKDAIDKTKEIDSKVSRLEEEVSTLRNYVPSVIFHAQVSEGGNPVGPTKLIYDRVDINNGQAYDASSGNFIAPMNGIFYFSYSLLGQKQSLDSMVQLMKNGVAQSYIHSILQHGQAQTASMSIILPLVRGDIVWVELLQGITWSEMSSMYFQGFLLQRT
ncbi:complement C1q tumor necrosis factor-related protein 3-like [Hypanus sabinus]|uniref:complement C1q tumor necrosis factor-related protein 3-like n=1 Tax=Hypanus sabinus TaxID=79690 RepID=UPI0028C4BE11|nr:complement C1q tumor necrosis factor-related protein 3-like [Hypanus sabinus]